MTTSQMTMSQTTMSKSSRRWLDRHVNDPYVQRAQREGYRSRAAYKLLELDAKDRLLRRGQTVVDLGAAPGGWSQVAARLVAAGAPGGRVAARTAAAAAEGGPVAPPASGGGRVIALDLLPMLPIDGVEFLQGDFRDEADFARLTALLGGAVVDLVLSDMAPNSTGMQTVDQPRAMLLVELAAGFAERVLKPGGALVVKSFQGAGFDELVRGLRGGFERVATRKPAASRPDSREVYLVAKGRRVG